MISSVTPTTISILTTSTAAGTLAVIGIITLCVLLVQKELAAPAEDLQGRQLARAYNIGIVPLMVAFVLVIAFEIVQHIR